MMPTTRSWFTSCDSQFVWTERWEKIELDFRSFRKVSEMISIHWSGQKRRSYPLFAVCPPFWAPANAPPSTCRRRSRSSPVECRVSRRSPRCTGWSAGCVWPASADRARCSCQFYEWNTAECSCRRCSSWRIPAGRRELFVSTLKFKETGELKLWT